MPTALVRIYTPDGYVLASDSRKLNSDTGEVVSDDVQKIFPFGESLAFSVRGAVILGRKDDPSLDELFNFQAEFCSYLTNTPPAENQTLLDYAGAAAAEVQGRLSQVCSTEPVDLPTENDLPEWSHLILHVYFDGYLVEQPQSVHAAFYHVDGVPIEPKVASVVLKQSFQSFCGSEAIFAALIGRDDRFANYASLSIEKKPGLSGKLWSAAQLARRYIAACSSPEGRLMDPASCDAIGGDVQIATITLDRGFEWVYRLRT